MLSSNSQRREKSCYLPNQWRQPQSLNVNRSEQEASMEATLGRQRESDYSQQSPSQRVLQANPTHQAQLMGEEIDPFHREKSFHRRQGELIAQLPIPTRQVQETEGGTQPHVNDYRGLVQEMPKQQRMRREKCGTFQNSMRYPLTESFEEISYIPRDPQSMTERNFTEGNVKQLELTSYMQLPPVGHHSKKCGKCSEPGHMKRQCLANVTCDFCKTRSHATLACRTYANFVKEHPLTSSRKNTPEKFQNELIVNIEVARRVELELKIWQRENRPTGKPPLPQLRKQQRVNLQQHLNQESFYSQDIRVQMGEKMHTEVHHSQHVKHDQRGHEAAMNTKN